jgi:hypothetical protein
MGLPKDFDGILIYSSFHNQIQMADDLRAKSILQSSDDRDASTQVLRYRIIPHNGAASAAYAASATRGKDVCELKTCYAKINVGYHSDVQLENRGNEECVIS